MTAGYFFLAGMAFLPAPRHIKGSHHTCNDMIVMVLMVTNNFTVTYRDGINRLNHSNRMRPTIPLHHLLAVGRNCSRAGSHLAASPPRSTHPTPHNYPQPLANNSFSQCKSAAYWCLLGGALSSLASMRVIMIHAYKYFERNPLLPY